MKIKEVYEKYKHLDRVERLGRQSVFEYPHYWKKRNGITENRNTVIYELWQAIKERYIKEDS